MIFKTATSDIQGGCANGPDWSYDLPQSRGLRSKRTASREPAGAKPASAKPASAKPDFTPDFLSKGTLFGGGAGLIRRKRENTKYIETALIIDKAMVSASIANVVSLDKGTLCQRSSSRSYPDSHEFSVLEANLRISLILFYLVPKATLHLVMILVIAP